MVSPAPEALTGISAPCAWPWKAAKIPTLAMAARAGGVIPEKITNPKIRTDSAMAVSVKGGDTPGHRNAAELHHGSDGRRNYP